MFKKFQGPSAFGISMFLGDFLSLTEQACEASSIYLTVHKVALECIRGSGFWNGLGTDGLKSEQLNFTMKKKQPRKTPCGAEPGRTLGVDKAPLNFRTMLLSGR